MAGTERDYTLFESRIKRLYFSHPWGKGYITHAHVYAQKGFSVVKSMGTMPGHNEACFSQMLSLQDPSWLRGACPPRAKVLKQISWVSEQNRKILPEGRQRPRRNALYK